MFGKPVVYLFQKGLAPLVQEFSEFWHRFRRDTFVVGIATKAGNVRFREDVVVHRFCQFHDPRHRKTEVFIVVDGRLVVPGDRLKASVWQPFHSIGGYAVISKRRSCRVVSELDVGVVVLVQGTIDDDLTMGTAVKKP